MVAPSTLTVPGKSLVRAALAVNPGRSGRSDTSIIFHDCRVPISIDAVGPELCLSCPALKHAELLVERQGMLARAIGRQKGLREEHQDSGMSWDELVQTVPFAAETTPIRGDEPELNMV